MLSRVYVVLVCWLLGCLPVHGVVPNLSDVAFSSRWVHPTDSSDKLNTLQMMSAFHATELLWIYLNDPVEKDEQFVSAVNSLGIPIQGTVSTAVMIRNLPSADKDMNIYGIKLNVHQKMKSTLDSHVFAGCPSSVIFQDLITRKFTKALSLAISSLQIDDWNFSYFAKMPNIESPHHENPGYKVEKCYCNYCLEHFRTFLKSKSSDELAKAGVKDVDHFDYRLFVLKKGWDPNRIELPIEEWYNESARNILTDFWKKNYDMVQQIAQRKISMSANNYEGQWAPIQGPFDFGLCEIGPPYTEPQYIYDNIQTSMSELKRPQVYSFASSSIQSNRHMIAMATASGGIALVPWDVYRGAHPRFYGLPQDYADLYGMIRAIGPTYLDGYQSLYAGGWNLKDAKTPSDAIELLGTDSVTAYVREMENGQGLPLVVHFVEVKKAPRKFGFRLKVPKSVEVSNLKCTLFVPVPYNEAMHSAAEASRNYDQLVHSISLHVEMQKEMLHVDIPAVVSPWGVMVIEKLKP